MSDATTAAADSTAATTSLMGGEAATTAATTTATTAATDTTAAVDTSKTEAATEAAKTDDAAKTDKPAGAPETYEAFKLPETLKLDETLMGEFGTLAKELNLPQEAAQKLVDIAAKMQTGTVESLQAAIETQSTQWVADSKADKEFGGDSFNENLAVAIKARDAFATPELKKLLDDSKLGNHPEVIRLFYRAGKAISQDGFVPGRQGGARPTNAEVLYKH